MIRGVLKAIVQFVIVGLPSWFILVWKVQDHTGCEPRRGHHTGRSRVIYSALLKMEDSGGITP